MKLIVVADTSALLSLALSGLFELCKRHFEIITGERVAKELEEISLRKDELGKAAKEVLRTIEVTATGKKFSKGEDEAFELLGKNKSRYFDFG